MADLLSEVRKGLEQRLKELEAQVEEHAHLRAALDALEGAGTRTRRVATTGARRATTAARQSASGARSATTAARRSATQAATATARRGRPRGSGARAQEALKHVHGNPGITIAEIAKRMKIKPNYLYRILPNLEKEGKVKKHNKGYHPADGSAADGKEKQSS